MSDPEDRPPVGALTTREREVLRLIADGLTHKDIAQRLFLSPLTVKWYSRQIYDKLGVKNRAQAVTYALLNGLHKGQASVQPVSPRALPSQDTPLLGRQEALTDITRLLQVPSCRILTLTGPGGIGKTRLAIEAGALLAPHWDDGVVFVPFTSVTTADQFVITVAEAVACPIHPAGTPELQLYEYLRHRRMLLVLDNFEHILAAADFLPDVLREAPKIKLLVTSREALRLREERVYPVQGLAAPTLPDDPAWEEYPAIQLFLNGARQRGTRRALQHEQPYIIRICQLLQGMPLAIELAAPWCRTLSAAEILSALEKNLDLLNTGLRNIPERHRSMRAVFAWSWNLLRPAEQEVLIRLSAFGGSFSRDAALSVADATVESLAALVDKSLLFFEGGRYVMHQLIRQYAYEKLAETVYLKPTRDQHLLYFMEYVEAIPLKVLAPDKERRIETDYGNLRLALEWCLHGEGSPELGLRLAVAIADWWCSNGLMAEGRGYLEGILARVTVATNTHLYARGLLGLAWLLGRQSDLTRAAMLCNEAVPLAERFDDHQFLSLANNLLGTAARLQKDYAAAATKYQRAVEYALEVGDKGLIALTFINQAILAAIQADFAAAQELFGKGAVLFREIGNEGFAALALDGLGRIARKQGYYRRAAAHIQECIRIAWGQHDLWSLSAAVAGLAALCADLRLWELASQLCGIDEAIRTRIGIAVIPAVRADHERTLTLLKQHLTTETFESSWTSGQRLSLEQVLVFALEVITDVVEPASRRQGDTFVDGRDALTKREREILCLMGDGRSNRAIAASLMVTLGTVAKHSHHIFQKLGVVNRTQAVMRARDLELI